MGDIEMSGEGDQEHGVECGLYDNIMGDVFLRCLCGKACRGSNWEEAGGEMDDHLEDVSDGD